MGRTVQRVMVLVVLIAAVTGGGLLWSIKSAGGFAHPAPSREPWIGLPAAAMDAKDWKTRDVLDLASRLPDSDLARSCGRYEDGGTEIYMAYVDDSALNHEARAWHIALSVHGDYVNVITREASFPPAPPLPPSVAPRLTQEAVPLQRVKIAHAWFDKPALEDIARAWQHPAIWKAPQGSPACSDGTSSFFEACVHGRYAAFNRSCDFESTSAVRTFWEAVLRLLPAPE